MQNPLAKCVVDHSHFAEPSSRDPKRKRRLEEVLDLDLFIDGYDGMFSTKRFRPDTTKALESFMQSQMREGELSLKYTHMGRELLDSLGTRPIQFAPLEVPAFGTDPTDEVPLVGKFDLIANTLTPLYERDSPPIEHNCLLFQFMGLSRVAYSGGEAQPNNDVIQTVIESQVYGQADAQILDNGVIKSCKDVETEVRLLNSVEQAFWLHLGDTSADPVSTLVPFGLLQKHIIDCNQTLKSQYSVELHGRSYTELKERVVDHHGPDSVIALMVHMDSPELFYDTFVPRGICSSTCTGKTAPYCNGAAYQGLVTLQVSGLLDVDVEDGDKHLSVGTSLDTAYLYLVVEMKQLVHNDPKFNFPWIRLLLTPKNIDQVQEDLLLQTEGRCHLTRDGMLSTAIIKPIAKLRVGPHCVGDGFSRDGQQSSQFDLVLSPNMRRCRFVPYQLSFDDQ